MMVLIDSSVWISVLRSKADQSLSDEVTGLLSAGRAALADPVWLELFRGAKGQKEEDRLQALLELCQWLEFDKACWDTAAQLGRMSQRACKNVPTGDLLVFSCARRHGAALLHRDRHFEQLEALSPV